MKIRQNNRKAESLLALLLFAVFAVCILTVLLTGADVYQRLSSRDQSSYDQRTAAQYLATRIRQADTADGVTLRVFEGRDALVLVQEIDGVRYETMLYCHDGYLCELFMEAEALLDEDGAYTVVPEDGEKVLAADTLLVYPDTPETGLWEMHLRTGEQEQVLLLHLRSGEEAAA